MHHVSLQGTIKTKFLQYDPEIHSEIKADDNKFLHTLGSDNHFCFNGFEQIETQYKSQRYMLNFISPVNLKVNVQTDSLI